MTDEQPAPLFADAYAAVFFTDGKEWLSSTDIRLTATQTRECALGLNQRIPQLRERHVFRRVVKVRITEVKED